MSNAFPIPSRAVRRVAAPVLQPPALFSWHGRFASLNALTGQIGTLTATSADNTVDGNDAIVLAGYGVPAWYSYPIWFPSPEQRVLGLFMRSTRDALTWPSEITPQTMTVLLEGINTNGLTPVNGAGVLHIGNDAATGNALSIVGTATTYQLTLTTGGGSVSATLTEPMGNFRYRMLAQLEDNGTTQRIRIGASLNESAFNWSAWSSTLTRASSFPSGSKVRLNRIGNTGSLGNSWFRRVSIYRGLLTLDEATARL